MLVWLSCLKICIYSSEKAEKVNLILKDISYTKESIFENVIMSKIDNLSWKEIYIEKSHSGDFLWVVSIGELVADYGLAQVVYKTQIKNREHAIKILREKTQENFSFTWGKRDFSKIDFYGTCIEALKELKIQMPETSDAINIVGTSWVSSGLAFIQSFIDEEIIEDKKTVDLPDIWKITWTTPSGTERPLNFQEWFYLPNKDITLFADWDKYFHQLKLAAETLWVKTHKDLEKFKQTIISSM
jgi:hypothetical protein